MVLTRSQAKVAFHHIMDNVLGMYCSSKLKSVLVNEGYVDIISLVTIDDDTIEELSYEYEDGTATLLTVPDGDKNVLKVWKMYYAYLWKSGTINDLDSWMNMTQDGLDKYRNDPTNGVHIHLSIGKDISLPKSISTKSFSDSKLDDPVPIVEKATSLPTGDVAAEFGPDIAQDTNVYVRNMEEMENQEANIDGIMDSGEYKHQVTMEHVVDSYQAMECLHDVRKEHEGSPCQDTNDMFCTSDMSVTDIISGVIYPMIHIGIVVLIVMSWVTFSLSSPISDLSRVKFDHYNDNEFGLFPTCECKLDQDKLDHDKLEQNMLGNGEWYDTVPDSIQVFDGSTKITEDFKAYIATMYGEELVGGTNDPIIVKARETSDPIITSTEETGETNDPIIMFMEGTNDPIVIFMEGTNDPIITSKSQAEEPNHSIMEQEVEQEDETPSSSVFHQPEVEPPPPEPPPLICIGVFVVMQELALHQVIDQIFQVPAENGETTVVRRYRENNEGVAGVVHMTSRFLCSYHFQQKGSDKFRTRINRFAVDLHCSEESPMTSDKGQDRNAGKVCTNCPKKCTNSDRFPSIQGKCMQRHCTKFTCGVIASEYVEDRNSGFIPMV